jgi:hypothetical protein
MSKAQTDALVAACKERAQNTCLYTSTTFFIWLRLLRTARNVLAALSVILGAIAAWKVLKQEYELVMAVCALLAAIIPPLQRALGLDAAIERYTKLGAEFKNLEGRFLLAAQVTSLKPFSEFEAEVLQLLKRLDDARLASATPPQFCFWLARHQIKKGHYNPDL